MIQNTFREFSTFYNIFIQLFMQKYIDDIQHKQRYETNLVKGVMK